MLRSSFDHAVSPIKAISFRSRSSFSSYELPPSVMIKRWFFKDPPVSKKNVELSQLDKAALVLMYPRSQPHDDAPEWTIERALKVVGVPKRHWKTILGDRSPDGIRSRFVAWNQKSRWIRWI